MLHGIKEIELTMKSGRLYRINPEGRRWHIFEYEPNTIDAWFAAGEATDILAAIRICQELDRKARGRK